MRCVKGRRALHAGHQLGNDSRCVKGERDRQVASKDVEHHIIQARVVRAVHECEHCSKNVHLTCKPSESVTDRTRVGAFRHARIDGNDGYGKHERSSGALTESGSALD